MLLSVSVLVLVIMLLGLPIAYAFGFGAFLYLVVEKESLGLVAATAFNSTNSYAYLAIPLFVLAGELMTSSGIADRLVNFAATLLRRVKGGMGAAIVLASMMFGMLTGSNIATITAVAGFMYSSMSKMGWEPRYIAALLATCGPLGYMIPPNTHAIMYAVVSNESVSDLFLCTIIPGVIWGIGVMLVNRLMYKKYFHPELAMPEFKQLAMNEGKRIKGDNYAKDSLDSFIKAIPALLMPVIIFGGIYGGVFTATEAGGVSCLYAIIVGVFFFRNMRGKVLWGSFKNVGVAMGVILFMTPTSTVFTHILLVNGAPQGIAHFLMALSSNSILIMLLIDLVFVIAGFFLAPIIIIYVITPLILPTALAVGIDPIQLGAIMFVAIGVGNVTPPAAPNVYIAARICKAEVTEVLPPVFVQFALTGVPMLLLVTFVPELSTWLPSLFDA
jgi:C4-dicarboxylate transporter DctM subunit